MAFPAHHLFQFGGTLLGGAEIWSCGIRFTGGLGGDGSVTNYAGALDDLELDVTTWMTTSGGGWSSATRLEWVKYNKIGPTGAYADQSTTHVKELATPVAGTNAPGTYVPQVALAVSWGTDNARGRASKGRIFIPMPSLDPAGTGKANVTAVGIVADAAATFITNLRNWPGIDLPDSPIPSVVSGVSATGDSNPITSVRVGDILDTQRRRRNALVETYTTRTL